MSESASIAQKFGAAEFERSKVFFGDTSSYVPFDVTKDGRRIIGCIEPRDESDPDGAPRDLKVIIQGDGGAYGQAVHLGLARTAAGEGFTPIEAALVQDSESRPDFVLGGHDFCAYWGNLLALLGEQAHPSDFTVDGLARSLHYYELAEPLKPLIGPLKGAILRHEEHLKEHGQGDILPQVAALYPDHSNTFVPLGENNAGIWVTNRLPALGLNRGAKHREQQLTVQGYHFSEAALLESLVLARGMSREVRDFRALALLLGGAAARTLLGGKHEDTAYYSAIATNNGPKVLSLPGHSG